METEEMVDQAVEDLTDALDLDYRQRCALEERLQELVEAVLDTLNDQTTTE